MGIDGDKVYEMHLAGQAQEINDYCMFDTLDTYFVFLRTRVLTGELTADQERALQENAREWLTAKAAELPALHKYLDIWQPSQPQLAAATDPAPVILPHSAEPSQSP
jgi:3'-5' exonuclease